MNKIEETISIDARLDKIKLPIYYGIMTVIYLSYALAFFGIWYVNQNYIYILNVVVQTFVCAFLIYRFHPFRTHELRKYDAKLIFGSGMILFINLVSVELLKIYNTYL
jgi:hypothetical protein